MNTSDFKKILKLLEQDLQKTISDTLPRTTEDSSHGSRPDGSSREARKLPTVTALCLAAGNG